MYLAVAHGRGPRFWILGRVGADMNGIAGSITTMVLPLSYFMCRTDTVEVGKSEQIVEMSQQKTSVATVQKG